MEKGMIAAGVAAVLLAMPGAARAGDHAPWPIDWNDWNDPALWCTVGDRGNPGELSGWEAARDYMGGVNRVCGAVNYTYRIGKFEVTAGQYCQFLNSVGATDTYNLYNSYAMDQAVYPGGAGCNIKRSGSPGNYTYSVDSDFANRPVNWVSWGDAARYANWMTNGRPTGMQDLSTTEDGSYYLNGATSNASLQGVVRKPGAVYAIPSEDEWYKAAYYKGGSTSAGYWDYPTRSNVGPFRDMADISGNNANTYIGSPFPIDSGRYFTTVVGEFQNSPSPYGTFDQGGNVAEWNESIMNDYGTGRGLRGTGFTLYPQGVGAAYRMASANPSDETADHGFRLVEVPEPCTLALLAAGGIAILGRRRGGR